MISHMAVEFGAARPGKGKATSTGAGDIAATVYCHSYPFRQCRLHVIDPMTLELSCALDGIPRHAFVEVALELFVDGELRRFRQPVHLLERDGDSTRVRFSFEPDRALKAALADAIAAGWTVAGAASRGCVAEG